MLWFVNFQQLDDQEANEGRVTIIDVRRGRSHVDDMKKFLKDAQQIRQKVVDIEGLVNQIRQYHRDITGAASRNEGVIFIILVFCFASCDDIRRRQLVWNHPRKWKLKNELVNKNRFLLLEVHKRLNQAMDDIRRLFDTVKGALKIMDDEYKVRMILLFEFLLNFMSY